MSLEPQISETFGDEKCAVRMANTHRILQWLAVTVVKLEDYILWSEMACCHRAELEDSLERDIHP